MSDGNKQELPSGHLAEILEFPLPGSKRYNCLKLDQFRRDLIKEIGYGIGVEVLESAMYLHDIEVVDVTWDELGEPVFQLKDKESDNPVQDS